MKAILLLCSLGFMYYAGVDTELECVDNKVIYELSDGEVRKENTVSLDGISLYNNESINIKVELDYFYSPPERLPNDEETAEEYLVRVMQESKKFHSDMNAKYSDELELSFVDQDSYAPYIYKK